MDLKHLSLSLGMLAFATSSQVQAQSYNQENRPNVIFIYADDLGRGMLSHFGQEYINTPNIDKIYKQGTSFDYCYGASYSAPARFALLTGYSDVRNEYWNKPKGGPYFEIEHANDYETLIQIEDSLNAMRIEPPVGDLYLATVFKRAGYRTAQYGKLDWGFASTRQQIREHGWDDYCGTMDHQVAHAFYPHYYIENDTIVWFPENTAPDWGIGTMSESPENYKKRWDMTGKVTYSQDIWNDRISSFIKKNKDEPFFIWHSTTLPHGPVGTPLIYPEIQQLEELSSIEKEYLSMVKTLDNSVGMILKELEVLGIDDNTIIMFSSDNGHQVYYENENRNQRKKEKSYDIDGRQFNSWDYAHTSERAGDRFDGNNGLTGKKRDTFDGGIRVPMAIMYPGHIPSGKTSKQVITNYDWLPTFADMLNIQLPYQKDGISLMPILKDEKINLTEKRYFLTNSKIGVTVVSSDHWKLRYNNKKNEFRLYYLPDDYKEEKIMNDLRPDKLEELKVQIEPYLNLKWQ